LKASKTSIADVDVEMTSEVNSSGTAQTGCRVKIKLEMPEGVVEIHHSDPRSCSTC
jgi:hypothetical protein